MHSKLLGKNSCQWFMHSKLLYIYLSRNKFLLLSVVLMRGNKGQKVARPKGTTKSVNIGARVTPETDLIWETMAAYLGISKVACLEQALRRMARQEGLLDGGKAASEELQSMIQALKTSTQEKPAHQDVKHIEKEA